MQQTEQQHLHFFTTKYDIKRWIKLFCPRLESLAHFSNILPSWGPFCPACNPFCPLSKSGQEKGCFGMGLGCFYDCWVKNWGLWWCSGQNETHLGNMRSIWAICTKSGQKYSRIGKKNVSPLSTQPQILNTEPWTLNPEPWTPYQKFQNPKV